MGYLLGLMLTGNHAPLIAKRRMHEQNLSIA
jgi:hypothetical protein